MRPLLSSPAHRLLLQAMALTSLLALSSNSMAEPAPAVSPAAAATTPASNQASKPPATTAPANTTGKTAGTASPAAAGKAATDAGKPAQPTAQQYQQEIKKGTVRIQQLEKANQDALARNQELQLGNDNLTVQVQVLQSERSAQMFLYGAATLGMGTILGFILCNFMLGKRNRRW